MLIPDKRGNLFIFEAIILLEEYERRLAFLYQIKEGTNLAESRYREDYGDTEYIIKSEIDINKIKKEYDKLEIKKRKLQQAIHMANLKYYIEFDGEKITLSEALIILGRTRYWTKLLIDRIKNTAVIKIIHKEERDIKINLSQEKYSELFNEFEDNIRKINQLERKIKLVNHSKTVDFKDEK